MASPAPDPADNPILSLISELLRIANESPEPAVPDPPAETPEQRAVEAFLAAIQAAKADGIEVTHSVEPTPE